MSETQETPFSPNYDKDVRSTSRSTEEETAMMVRFLEEALAIGRDLISREGLKPDGDGYYSLKIVASSSNPDEGFLQACTQAKARGISGIDIVPLESRKIENLPREELSKVETYAQKYLVAWNPDQMIESVPGYVPTALSENVTQNQPEEQQEQIDDPRKEMAKRAVHLFLSSVQSTRAKKIDIGNGWMQAVFLQSDSVVQNSIALDAMSLTYEQVARGYRRDDATQGEIITGTEHRYKVSWNEAILKQFLES